MEDLNTALVFLEMMGASPPSKTIRPAEDHLSRLKALTEKLNLEPSPSCVDWRTQLETMLAQSRRDADEHKTSGRMKLLLEESDAAGQALGFGSIDQALEWLRKELVEMRVQDEQLARQLMRLRSDINSLKIEQTCNQHRKMLNAATIELEERDDMCDLCDVPVTPGLGLSAPLKVIGVTKMNINSRRFSLC